MGSRDQIDDKPTAVFDCCLTRYFCIMNLNQAPGSLVAGVKSDTVSQPECVLTRRLNTDVLFNILKTVKPVALVIQGIVEANHEDHSCTSRLF